MQEPKRFQKVLFAIGIAPRIRRFRISSALTPNPFPFILKMWGLIFYTFPLPLYDDRGAKMLIWVQEGSKQAILVSEKKIYSEKSSYIQFVLGGKVLPKLFGQVSELGKWMRGQQD